MENKVVAIVAGKEITDQDINKVIDKSEDFICIIKVMSEGVFDEEVIGVSSQTSGEELII